jgi:hypothetical protein
MYFYAFANAFSKSLSPGAPNSLTDSDSSISSSLLSLIYARILAGDFFI